MTAIADSQCRPDVLFLSSVSAITRFGVYGESKYRAEEIIAERAQGRWVALRSSLIHGRGDTKNVGMLVRAARRWPAIPVVGASSVKLQPLYVHDLADAFLALLGGRGVPSTRYIVSGPRQERLIDMIRMIQSRVGRFAPLIPIPLEPVRYTVAIADRFFPFLKLPVQQVKAASNHPPYQSDAAHRDLGFSPRSFEAAIADYL
jgi:nucleoside-diphosphate-sugar epimerase